MYYYHTIRYILIELVILPPDNANVVIAEDDRILDIVPRFVTAAHRSSGAERVPGIISSHLISVSGVDCTLMIPVFMRHSPSAGHSDIEVLDKALHLC